MSDSGPRKLFLIWPKPTDRYERLCALLAKDGWRANNLDNINNLLDICQAAKHNDVICLAVLNPCTKYFNRSNLNLLHKFCDSGGKLLLAASGRDDSAPQEGSISRANLNAIATARYSIQFNDDCIIRPNPYKLYHPKEAKLENFTTNRGLSDALKRYVNSRDKSTTDLFNEPREANLVYPHGCSIKVLDRRKATVMMTSSQWAIPSQQAICTFHSMSNDGGRQSRVVAIGSSALFGDSYIAHEDNEAIVRCLFDFISDQNFSINISDARTVEIPDVPISTLPDFQRLIDVPVPCLQTTEELPEDKLTLIERKLFSIDTSDIPKILRAYQQLDVPRGPLTLIKPPALDLASSIDTSNRYILRRSADDRSESANTNESA